MCTWTSECLRTPITNDLAVAALRTQTMSSPSRTVIACVNRHTTHNTPSNALREPEDVSSPEALQVVQGALVKSHSALTDTQRQRQTPEDKFANINEVRPCRPRHVRCGLSSIILISELTEMQNDKRGQHRREDAKLLVMDSTEGVLRGDRR